MQLSLPLGSPGVTPPPPPKPTEAPLPHRLVGSWSGGERLVVRRGTSFPAPAHVWFHFFVDGRASFTIRYSEAHTPVVCDGSWCLDDGMLVVQLGRTRVQSRPQIRDGLLHWAGEVLVRLPEGLPPFPAMQL